MFTDRLDDEAPPEDAIEALILAHQSYARALAYRIAKRLSSRVDPEELAAYACIGLTEAAKRFDPDMGVAFTTFSYYRIRGAVFDGLREMSWLPPEARRETRQDELTDALTESGLGEVGLDADAEELARSFREATRTLGAVFLLAEFGEEGSVEPVDETSAADHAAEAELTEKLRTAMAELEEDELHLVRALYFEGRSMSEVGEELGVNKSTVCRAHARAIAKLKEHLVT